MEEILFYLHYALLLLFGILLSAAFSGIRIFERKNLFQIGICFAFCGLLQLWGYFSFGEETVWKIYPLIAHFPIVFWLCVFFKKGFLTALFSVFSAYLCCQPANWVGLSVGFFSKSFFAEASAQIFALILTGFISIKFIAPNLSEIFQKDFKSVLIFGTVPSVYYIFDYMTGIYSDLWAENNRITAEFLPLFLCVVFLIFCTVYYKEYEQKAEAKQREQLIGIVSEQRAKEIEVLKKSEKETKILRHDMRHLLSNVAVCLDNNENEKAKELISAYVQKIDRTKPLRFCENETLNCVLADFSAKCELFSVDFYHNIAFEKIECDEIIFASILSNALENALNEQKKLLGSERNIHLLLKTVDGKLLLSVKNPFKNPPVFSEGIPVTDKNGHGTGCRSIRYMAEKLGGNCRFSLENGYFSVKVII